MGELGHHLGKVTSTFRSLVSFLLNWTQVHTVSRHRIKECCMYYVLVVLSCGILFFQTLKERKLIHCLSEDEFCSSTSSADKSDGDSKER